MSSFRRALGGLAVAAALVAPLAASPAADAATPGYTWLLGEATGVWPGGLKVWVVPSKHVHADVALAKFAVRQLRLHRIPVTFKGTKRHPSATDTIVVREVRSLPGSELGVGKASASVLPTGQAFVTSGRVQISRRTYRFARVYRRLVFLHEFGHAIGLGHYTRSYHGHLQVMYPSVTAGSHRTAAYQDGDENGLAAIHRVTGVVRRALGG